MELFKLLGTIAIDSSGAVEAINDTTQNAEKAESKVAKAFEKIGSAAGVVGKTMAAGLAAGATAMAGLTTKALNLAGELEQNLGGSEAVYGKYADKMQKKAKEAYKNMGLAASDYLATANKMGALFKGAGFDASEASELSAEAMQRAADVASIMGISIESAMESVAGAAKGNFTMMDNLGVAMNETNLEAYALSKGIKKAYTEMTQQEKIGLAMEMFLDKTSYATGNYAKENETLAGSLGTAKAALSNFLSGAGTASEVVESVVSAGRVVTANLNKLLPELVAGLNQLITELLPHLPELVNSLLPGIIQGAVALLNGLVAALPTILQILIEQMPYIVTEIGKGLAEAFPILLETVKTLFGQIWGYVGVSSEDAFAKISEIINTAWEKIQPLWDKISGAFKTFSEEVLKPLIEIYLNNLQAKFETMVAAWQTVVVPVLEIVIDAFNRIATSIKDAAEKNIMPAVKKIIDKFNELSSLIQKVVKEYIIPVIQSFVEMIQELYEENKDKLDLLAELFSAVFEWISERVTKFVNTVKEKVMPFLEFIKNLVMENMDKIKSIFQSAINFITGIVQFFIALFKGDWAAMWESVKSTVKSGVDFVNNIFELLESFLRGIITKIVETVTKKFEEIKNTMSNKIREAKDKVTDTFGNMVGSVGDKLDSIKEKVTETFNKIKSTIKNKIEDAKDVVEEVVDSIKDFFNFEVSLPDIKLPHFSIEPDGWELGDLLDGVIPELDIDWYAKGGVMEKPTVFGMSGNRLMAGGEAGPEAIAPIDVLQDYIAQAVASQNAAMVAVLQQILDAILSMDENMGGNLRDALEGTAFEMNHREFARLVKAVN